MNATRWKEGFLLLAIVCFVAAPVGNVALLMGIESPVVEELEATHLPHGGSGPGHFMPAAMVGAARLALTTVAFVLGVAFAVLGSVGTPSCAPQGRKLRDVTWLVFCMALIACFGIAIR